MTSEQIEQRTQDIVCQQIGELVLTSARRKAEAEAMQAEIARLTAELAKATEPKSEPA